MDKQSQFAHQPVRRFMQVATIYVVAAWCVAEILLTVAQKTVLPEWASTLTTISLIVGFPVTMFLTWTFSVAPDGVRRTRVGSLRGISSIALATLLLLACTAGIFFLTGPTFDSGSVAPGNHSAPPDSVAVLPFEVTTDDPRDRHLGDGVSDELRDQLARVSQLRVTARLSSIAAQNPDADPRSVSARLGVANLVTGSVERHGDDLRVSVNLFSAANGRTAWSETFTGGTRMLPTLQQDVAEAVVQHILPNQAAPATEPATWDPTAYEFLLLARHYERQSLNNRQVDDAILEEAVRLYREAVNADPGSALAHSRLAGALLTMHDLDSAEGPIFQALLLAPGLAEVQTTLGDYYRAHRMPDAGDAWALAIELNPNNPHALQRYAKWRWQQADIQGIAGMFRRALQLDPLNPGRYNALGSYMALQNHNEQARSVVKQVRDRLDGADSYRVMANLLDLLGDVDQSIAWTIKARDLEPGNPGHIAKLADYFADLGDFDTALQLDPDSLVVLYKSRNYESFIDKAEPVVVDRPDDLPLRAALATAYNATGQFDATMQLLQSGGLPESFINGWRSPAERGAFVALVNALFGAGESDSARELAQRYVEFGSTDNSSWLTNISAACHRSMLGEDNEVREYFTRLLQGISLPSDPILLDSPCFERFADDPHYQAVVEHYNQRRALLLKRLPETLNNFGVKL